MKIKYKLEIVDMGEEKVAVPVGEGASHVHGILKINHEGQEILELLSDNTTIEEIVETLGSKYENNRDELQRYVDNFIVKLNEIGILEA